MAQQRISSVIPTGRQQSTDENFTELYTAVDAASAAIAALQAGAGAWTSYSPTIAAGGGTLTTATATGAYTTNGKTVHFRARAVITTNGTGATSVIVGLPATAAATVMSTPIFGHTVVPSNISIIGVIASGGTTVAIYDYAGTYPGGDGTSMTVAGTYEKA